METTGVIGERSSKFIAEIGRRIKQCTGEAREVAWLRQRISIAIMRGKATSNLATMNRPAFGRAS